MSRVCPHLLQWLVYVLVFSLTLNLINNLELSRPFFFSLFIIWSLGILLHFLQLKSLLEATDRRTNKKTDRPKSIQYIYGLDLWCIWHKINIHHCSCVHRNLLTKPLEIMKKKIITINFAAWISYFHW